MIQIRKEPSMDLQKEWHQQELQAAEDCLSHRPLEEEYAFYHAVSSGDINFVQENCSQNKFASPNGMGVLSYDPLTNMKYHFVVTVAMIVRHCVEAGMELEQAYRLSDFYILKMDACMSIAAICKLHDSMVLDYTGKMLLLKKRKRHIKACDLVYGLYLQPLKQPYYHRRACRLYRPVPQLFVAAF